jgi:hypothetical protein
VAPLDSADAHGPTARLAQRRAQVVVVLEGEHSDARYADPSGRFEFSGLAPGEYRIRAFHPRLGTATAIHSTDGGFLRLQLVRRTSVRGRVVDVLGNPVGGAQVRAFTHPSEWVELGDPQTLGENDGRSFRFEGAPCHPAPLCWPAAVSGTDGSFELLPDEGSPAVALLAWTRELRGALLRVPPGVPAQVVAVPSELVELEVSQLEALPDPAPPGRSTLVLSVSTAAPPLEPLRAAWEVAGGARARVRLRTWPGLPLQVAVSVAGYAVSRSGCRKGYSSSNRALCPASRSRSG